MSGLCIKIIALVSMIVDHAITAQVITQSLLMNYFHLSLMESYNLLNILQLFGRIAFPIFSFLIAEGCKRTHCIVGYVHRVLLFAMISEIPFDLAIVGSITWFYNLNTLFSYSIGITCILINSMRCEMKMGYRVCLMTGMIATALVVRTDYSIYAILMIMVGYYSKKKASAFNGMAGILFSMYVLEPWILNGVLSFDRFILWGASLLGLVIAFMYNGSYGNIRFKMLFYYAYPIHLTILAMFRIMKKF